VRLGLARRCNHGQALASLVVVVVVGLLALGCRAPSPGRVPPSPPNPTYQPRALPAAPVPAPPASADVTGTLVDGARCLVATQCASGVCEGIGCDDTSPGQCVSAARACTRDLTPFCGCDGATFEAASTCPGRRYARRGACS